METTLKILIEKDSATRIQKEVRSLEEARAFQHNGFVVHLVNDDGTLSDLPAETAEVVAADADPDHGETGGDASGGSEANASTGGGDQSTDSAAGTGE